jgi:hypothetical protein
LGGGFIDSLSDDDLQGEYSPLGRVKAGLNDDLDDLAAYVESLGRESLPRSPFRAQNGALSSTGLAGRQVFRNLNCQQCHADSAFTDGVGHDVGTLRSFSGNRLGGELSTIRTPSLLGAFDSAPYLHDGSAETLEDVFHTVGGVVYAAESVADVAFEQPILGNLRGGSAALLTTAGDTLTFSSIDGGRGGDGLLRIRGAAMQDGTVSMTLIVNGEEAPISFDFGDSALVGAEQSNIVELTGIEINLRADATNTLTFRLDAGSVPVLIDDITVSTPERIELAAPHTVARDLNATDLANLVSYINQLDRAEAPDDDGDIEIGHRDIQSPSVGNPEPDPEPEPEPIAEPEPSPEPEASQPGNELLIPAGEGGGSSELPIVLILLAMVVARSRKIVSYR